MIVALSRFRVANGLEAQVAAAFHDRPGLVDTAPGFLGLETFAGADDDAMFYLVTRWTNEASFRAWHRSPAHHASHRGIPKGLKLDPAFTRVVVMRRLAATADAPTLADVTADAAPVLADYLTRTRALYVIGADLDGRIRACSHAVAQRLQQPAAALVGASLWPLLTPTDAATLQQRIRDPRRAPDERLLLNLLDAQAVPYTLACAVDVRPDGFLLVGEVPAGREHAAFEQLSQINNELATLTRENARKARALERVNAQLQAEVAERQRAHEALRQQAALLDLARDAIVVRDPGSGAIRYWNHGAEALFGWSAAEAAGALVHRLLDTQFPQPRDAIQALVLGQGWWDGELVQRTRGGAHLVVASRWVVQRDAAGAPLAILESHTDITARKDAEARLRHEASHDALTGLPNRALFLDRLGATLAQGRAGRPSGAVFLLDLDGFKPVNDTHGHEAGDVVLREVGARLRHTSRPPDTVARLGGDEFALVLPDTDRAGAVRMAQRIIAALRVPIALGERTVRVGASLGIALAPEHGTEARTLLRAADQAMYRAKRGGHDHAIADASALVDPGNTTKSG